MRRFVSGRALMTLGAGAAVALLLGGGLVALIGDSVQVGSVVTSDDYQDPAEDVLDLAVVEVASPSSICDDILYDADDDVTIGGAATIDLAPKIDNGSFIRTEVGHFCLRNASDFDGVLSATLAARSSVEVGTCGSTEQTAEQALGPVSCTNGAMGELDGVLAISVENTPAVGAQSCDGSVDPHSVLFPSSDGLGTTRGFNDGTTLPDIVFGPGATCNITLAVTSAQGPSDLNLWKAGATDTLAFDMTISLEDPAG